MKKYLVRFPILHNAILLNDDITDIIINQATYQITLYAPSYLFSEILHALPNYVGKTAVFLPLRNIKEVFHQLMEKLHFIDIPKNATEDDLLNIYKNYGIEGIWEDGHAEEDLDQKNYISTNQLKRLSTDFFVFVNADAGEYTSVKGDLQKTFSINSIINFLIDVGLEGLHINTSESSKKKLEDLIHLGIIDYKKVETEYEGGLLKANAPQSYRLKFGAPVEVKKIYLIEKASLDLSAPNTITLSAIKDPVKFFEQLFIKDGDTSPEFPNYTKTKILEIVEEYRIRQGVKNIRTLESGKKESELSPGGIHGDADSTVDERGYIDSSTIRTMNKEKVEAININLSGRALDFIDIEPLADIDVEEIPPLSIEWGIEEKIKYFTNFFGEGFTITGNETEKQEKIDAFTLFFEKVLNLLLIKDWAFEITPLLEKLITSFFFQIHQSPDEINVEGTTINFQEQQSE